MKIFTPHQLLLMRRERNAVMGHRAMGIWMLSAVLIATFLSIAFSAGSMSYLDEKMNDPYTYWLNVTKSDSAGSIILSDVSDSLKYDSLLAKHYKYDNAQITISYSSPLLSKDGVQEIFHTQYYEDLGNDLIRKVLDESNVIESNGETVAIPFDSIDPNSMGVIITEDAMMQLGYADKNYPAYVNLNIPANGADTLGFSVFADESNKYVAAPIPLLAVVKRLPMHKDMIASRYMYLQYKDNKDMATFQMCNENYIRNLYFFVPEGVTNFEEEVKKAIPDSLRDTEFQTDANEQRQALYRSWKKGRIKRIFYLGYPNIFHVNQIEKNILDKLADYGVERIYDYNLNDSVDESSLEKEMYDGLSIHFTQLDSIRAFDKFLTIKWGKRLQVEMTQVNAKENFNSVSTMANILTIALIIFSIIAIVIFIVNMMQSYFQKVKRNLGTFKAFGISTKELIKVYMTIILGIVIIALAIALSVTWGVELLLQLFDCTKEGGAPHLILWNYRTLFAIVIILSSTVVSILIVMRQLLKQTPGDLIYDR